jgi:hypothetical protein
MRLHWLTSQLSVTFRDYHTLSHTQSLQFTLRADCDIFFVKLSPRSYSANSLLKTPFENSFAELLFKNWLCIAAGLQDISSYIILNRTSVIAATSRVRAVLRQVTWYSPTPVGVWRHRGMLHRNRIPILLPDVIASALKSCLPAGA